MDLEFQQLDRRYEQLRATCRQRDERVVASIARLGQQLPVVVVAGGGDGRFVLVDGYKRVRALVRLKHDTVRAICWDMPEAEALLLGRLMSSAEGDSALEQGWFLHELHERFALSIDELAQRFDRSASWVSRRLGLVRDLPEPIQELVRSGALVPHAAMKYLLPLARANRRDAVELAAAIAPLRPTTRQTQALCVAFARAGAEARQQLLDRPAAYLRACESNAAPPLATACLATQLFEDLGALGAIARRARRRATDGAVRELLAPELVEVQGRVVAVRGELGRLYQTLEQEIEHAGRKHAEDHSQPS
jgi:ParB/RepB/Spo0J family partition protein